MDTLRSVAHLQRELGDEVFGVLVSSDNTDAVRQFAQQLAGVLPTTMTVGGRTYEILGFLEGGEKSVIGHTMVKRAVKLEANMGEEDGRFILEHQEDIPAALRGKVVFVFTNWCRSGGPPGLVYDVCWLGGRWVWDYRWLGHGWHDCFRVLRRK